MNCKSILLNLDIDGPVAPVTKAAIELAAAHQARLIGFCAAEAPLPMAYPEGGAMFVEAWQQMRTDIGTRFKEMRREFEKLVPGSIDSEWRDALETPTQALVGASRSADLLVMRAAKGASTGDAYRVAEPGSVVLQAGRPLLVLSDAGGHMPPKKIVVAWRDTREARRAVSDAVPLLRMADDVTVVTVSHAMNEAVRQSAADVVTFLARHGVRSHSELLEGNDDSEELLGFLAAADADLVVSGAYGHSRLREWAFGGVTRSLLDTAKFNRFLSS